MAYPLSSKSKDIVLGRTCAARATRSAVTRGSDVRFEIVYGGITALQLQGRSFGNITLALSGEQQDVDQLIADLYAATKVEEIA